MRTTPAHRQPRRWSATDRHLRAVLLLLAAAAGLAAAMALFDIGWSAVTDWRSGPVGSRRPDQLLGGVCAGTSAALLVWVCCGVLLSVLSVLAAGSGAVGHRAARWSARLAPTFVRSAVAAALGGSLALATVSVSPPGPVTATASPAGLSPAGPATTQPPSPTRPAPDSGWTASPPPRPPARPGGEVGLVSATAARAGELDEQVTVRRGDSLWSIAARQLGPHATALDIARAWPRWYAANRQQIGPDPDRLQPGQLLSPPRDPACDRIPGPDGFPTDGRAR